jgi:hypothetical protein
VRKSLIFEMIAVIVEPGADDIVIWCKEWLNSVSGGCWKVF